MIGKNLRNLLLASAVFVAVPAITQASRYTGTTPPGIAVTGMAVDLPVAKLAVKHPTKKKHTVTTLAASRHVASKKKMHTTTIMFKHHHHKKAVTTTKAKKHVA